MSDQIFQNAYARVRGRHSDQDWFALSPREITDAIYREIRIIDSERLTSPWQYDDVPGQPERYPHIYGPLNPEAVVAVLPLESGPDGKFTFDPPANVG